MKTTNIAYWITTGLFSFAMVGSGIQHILSDPMSVKGFTDLGLPLYLLPLLGWAKVLGVVGILIPGYPRVKEWAYAGLQIDILGAIYCIAAVGTPVYMWAPLFVIVAVGFASYFLYHKRLALKAQPARETSKTGTVLQTA